MEIEKYKTLLTVIDCGSLSAAAELLSYTPSGVSRAIAALETELGFTLLYRSKKGVQPTKECKELLPACRQLVFSGERLSQTAAKIRGAECGTVVIGTAYSCYYQWITQMTSLIHSKYPGIQFRIINGTSTELIQKLHDHQLDFCIISAREGNHSWIPFCSDPMVAMLPADHPMTECEAVPVELFASEAYIETYPGQDVDNARIFSQCNIHPNTLFSTQDIYATYSMVEAGLGISMNNQINSRLWNGTVCHLPLSPDLRMEIGMAYSSEVPPAAAVFLSEVRKLPPEIMKTTLSAQK